MHRTIETGLKNPPAPHSWPTEANGTIYSVHIPIRPDGSIEDGDVAKQTEILLADLETTLVAAGAGPADVPLTQIFLTSLDHKPAVDEVHKRFFVDHLPVRACLAVSQLPTPGAVIEIVATTTPSAPR